MIRIIPTLQGQVKVNEVHVSADQYHVLNKNLINVSDYHNLELAVSHSIKSQLSLPSGLMHHVDNITEG